MPKSAPADMIPGARELSADELKMLMTKRQAVLDLMKEGRDLYLKNEKPPVSSSYEFVGVIRGWFLRSERDR